MDQLLSTLKFARTGGPHNDIVLNRAEELVDLNNGCGEDFFRLVYACDLFFTLDYWLKYYQTGPQFESNQAGQVQSLYGSVVTELCKAFQCTVNVLPRELELMFGRELTAQGHDVDVTQGMAAYVGGREELAKYRLRFKEGKAYQYPWWQSFLSGGALVLAESMRCQPVGTVHKGGDKPNWGYCAMSLNREIYMAQHAPATKDKRGHVRKGAYHSYYLQGQPTQFAGSMLIIGGEILAVMPDSGHYKPNDNNTLAFLQALLMYGIPLTHVAVMPWNGAGYVLAETFMAQKGDWNLLRQTQGSNRDANASAWLSKQSPAIQRWVYEREKYAEPGGTKLPYDITPNSGGSPVTTQVVSTPPQSPPPLQSQTVTDQFQDMDFIPDLDDVAEEPKYEIA